MLTFLLPDKNLMSFDFAAIFSQRYPMADADSGLRRPLMLVQRSDRRMQLTWINIHAITWITFWPPSDWTGRLGRAQSVRRKTSCKINARKNNWRWNFAAVPERPPPLHPPTLRWDRCPGKRRDRLLARLGQLWRCAIPTIYNTANQRDTDHHRHHWFVQKQRYSIVRNWRHGLWTRQYTRLRQALTVVFKK